MCWYTYVETSYSQAVEGHPEYDQYTGEWVWVPTGYESVVQGSWSPSCMWAYTVDPIPPPGGYTPPPDYTGSGISMWVTGVDASDPHSVSAEVSWHASAPACDMAIIRMFVGGWDHETLSGPMPYSVTMGHVELGDPGTKRLQFDGFDCRGDYAATASTFISREARSQNVATSIVLTFLDSGDSGGGQSYPVPVANHYTRTFYQEFIQTSFDVPAVNSGGVRYQLKGASDAIRFGPIEYLPGMPMYSDVWSSAGTSMGQVSENMNSQGYQYFDGTIAYARPEFVGPLYGFTPQVAVTIPVFQWMMSSGIAKCLITNASSTMSIE